MRPKVRASAVAAAVARNRRRTRFRSVEAIVSEYVGEGRGAKETPMTTVSTKGVIATTYRAGVMRVGERVAVRLIIKSNGGGGKGECRLTTYAVTRL